MVNECMSDDQIATKTEATKGGLVFLAQHHSNVMPMSHLPSKHPVTLVESTKECH